jgi:hypothetical protein
LKNAVDKTQHLNLRSFKLNYTFLQSEKAQVKKHEANRKILAGSNESPKREKRGDGQKSLGK